jgi:hypothetical protein
MEMWVPRPDCRQRLCAVTVMLAIALRLDQTHRFPRKDDGTRQGQMGSETTTKVSGVRKKSGVGDRPVADRKRRKTQAKGSDRNASEVAGNVELSGQAIGKEENTDVSSVDFQVDAFRQIIFLPLTLSHPAISACSATTTMKQDIEGVAKALHADARWTRLDDPLNPSGSPEIDPFAYGEFVYFHEFIQTLIYGREGEERGTDLTVFERRDLQSLTITLNKSLLGSKEYITGKFTARLAIDRLRLMLFNTGVAVAMIELSGAPGCISADELAQGLPFSLAHIMAIQNGVRRVYPPYFKKEKDGTLSMPEYPSKWVLEAEDGTCCTFEETASDFLKIVGGPPAAPGKHPPPRIDPLARIWSHALSPLKIAGAEGVDPREPDVFRQVVDERMPSMTFILAPKAKDVRQSDLERLCFMDNPGGDHPYSKAFIERTWSDHIYDRHWYGGGGTRYLISGYGFVVLGNDSPGNDFFSSVIGQHFRRMYAQMGLLLHFQHAMLIAISGWVSQAVANFEGDAKRKDLRRAMQAIQQDFLGFVQRYRFTNVSNQIQARELYTKWQHHIGVDEIYAEVAAQLKDANDFLDQQQQQAQTEAALAQTEAGLLLNKVAALGLGVGVPLTFLGAIDAGKIYGRFKLEKDEPKAFTCKPASEFGFQCAETKEAAVPWQFPDKKEYALLAHDTGVALISVCLGLFAVNCVARYVVRDTDTGKNSIRRWTSHLGLAAFIGCCCAFIAKHILG